MLLLASASTSVIFDFHKKADLKNWKIVDDVVMGGRSDGNFSLNKDGHGVFEGAVSLENNGGFSSVRYQFNKKEVKDFKSVAITLKGDGKDYQFRVKAKANDYYSYITTFTTTGEWQTVVINLKDMYPSFRGRKLDAPNFAHSHIEEVTFLIANSKNESFKLLLDKIELQ